MELHKNRSLDDHRYLGLGKLISFSSSIGLGVLAVGLLSLGLPTTASAGKVTVHPGESIQAAVDAAAPGDAVVVFPGTYMETHGNAVAVRIKKDGIKLIAKSNFKKDKRVVLVPGPGNIHGILFEPDPLAPDIQGAMIKGFTVQGFPNNGIKLERVNKFKILKNESIDNLENGIQPELSANGLVKKNLSYGSDDSALWVEGGENVRVLKNVVHSSVTGLEVTISDNVVIKKNEAYNNVVGMGLYHPNAASETPLPVMEHLDVEKNHVYDNNKVNTAPPGSMAAGLPTGGGILLLGIDKNTVKNNLIENNDFYGIALVDWCLAQSGTPNDCNLVPPLADPSPDYNRIEKNTLVDNGTAPDPSHPLAPFAADLVNVTLGATGNCYKKNTYSTYKSLTGGGPHQCP